MNRTAFRTGVAAVVCLVFIAGAGFFWYELAGPGYYSELNAIRGELERIPQVEIAELDGVHDLTLEHIWARIHIAGKGDMAFGGLDRDSVRDTKHLLLVSVGPYRIRVRGEGYVGVYKADTGKPVRSEFWGSPVDIAPEGVFAHLFPFKIPNIQTAVAHYEDIFRIIGAWPQESSQPRHFRDAKGTNFYYWVETKGVNMPPGADMRQ